MKSPYEYFSVAADVMALQKRGVSLYVLLIQRKNPPYQGAWALPGGFVDRDEDARTAAKREFLEETGLRCRKLVEFGSFSDPNRDPRGRVVTISFYAEISARESRRAQAGDDAGQVRWFSLKRLPRLAFDHKQMIRQGMKRYRENQRTR